MCVCVNYVAIRLDDHLIRVRENCLADVPLQCLCPCTERQLAALADAVCTPPKRCAIFCVYITDTYLRQPSSMITVLQHSVGVPELRSGSLPTLRTERPSTPPLLHTTYKPAPIPTTAHCSESYHSASAPYNGDMKPADEDTRCGCRCLPQQRVNAQRPRHEAHMIIRRASAANDEGTAPTASEARNTHGQRSWVLLHMTAVSSAPRCLPPPAIQIDESLRPGSVRKSWAGVETRCGSVVLRRTTEIPQRDCTIYNPPIFIPVHSPASSVISL